MTDEEVQRELARRLAAGTGDAVILASLLMNGGALHLPTVSGRTPVSTLAEDVQGFLGTQSTSMVGIWESDPVTGGFRRSRTHADLWRFCADVDQIPPKGIRPRVAFLGESVARGFFYDPSYAPAKVLSGILENCGKPVEVIDLAQSNIDGRSLSVLAASSYLLRPDVIVVFAGNNWQSPGLRLVSAKSFVTDSESVSNRRGFATIADRLRQDLTAYAETIVRTIVAGASTAGVPVVFVIPEINLSTWSNCPDGTLDLAVMEDEDVRSWLEAFAQAERAWESGDLRAAHAHLSRVIAIDAGVSAASLFRLGQVLLGLGDRSAAAHAFRQGRDITLRVIDGTLNIPGILEQVAETIRRVALESGASVVELPQVFEQYAATELYEGSLHLDYCHLTSQGIRLAMSATAETVGSILGVSMPPLPSIAATAPAPSDEEEGWAHLLAAVHNAHWGQTPDICARYIRRAIECHPALVDSAIPLIYDAFRHRAPAILVESFDSLVKNKAAGVYLIGYGVHYHYLGRVSEHRLLTALRAVDGSHSEIPEDPDYLLNIVQEIDLLDPHFSELTDGNRYFSRAFSAMYSPRSEWRFSCDTSQPVHLSLVFRIPGALASGDVRVFVNDASVTSLQVGAEWCSLRCVVCASIVTAGLNCLSVIWPNVARRDLRYDLRYDFEHGRPVDARIHFGEVHELRLSLTPQV